MSDQLLQQVLLEARTHNGWLAEPIDDATLHRLYEALRLGHAAFFADVPWKSILFINLGHGDPAKLYPRNPRLGFEEACRIA
ncbi:hypothetical protein [Sorangium sp. So ce693]|uniref:hypothetical protein n=1 Tax=Sorangium sp. So ce693 TaxID=3133318 RepID=UPI003F60E6E5